MAGHAYTYPVVESDSVLGNLEACLLMQSPRDRRALCDVVLAAYRVELTATLNRIAGCQPSDGDLAAVYELAHRIACAAETASLRAVQNDAVTLQVHAAAAQDGGSEDHGAMLVAGLRVIDRILAAAPLSTAGSQN